MLLDTKNIHSTGDLFHIILGVTLLLVKRESIYVVLSL